MDADAIGIVALILKGGGLDRPGNAARVVARDLGEIMKGGGHIGQLAGRFRIGLSDLARHQFAHGRRIAGGD